MSFGETRARAFTDRLHHLQSRLGQACGLVEVSLLRVGEVLSGSDDVCDAAEFDHRQVLAACAEVKKQIFAMAWHAPRGAALAHLVTAYRQALDLEQMSSWVPEVAYTAIAAHSRMPRTAAEDPQSLHAAVTAVTARLHHLLLDHDSRRATRLVADGEALAERMTPARRRRGRAGRRRQRDAFDLNGLHDAYRHIVDHVVVMARREQRSPGGAPLRSTVDADQTEEHSGTGQPIRLDPEARTAGNGPVRRPS